MTLGTLAFMLQNDRGDVLNATVSLSVFKKSCHCCVKQRKEAGVQFQFLLVLSIHWTLPSLPAPHVRWPCLLEPHSWDVGDELCETCRPHRAFPLGGIAIKIVSVGHSQSSLIFPWISTTRGFLMSSKSQRSVPCPFSVSFLRLVLLPRVGSSYEQNLRHDRQMAGFGSSILVFLYSSPWLWVWLMSCKQMW